MDSFREDIYEVVIGFRGYMYIYKYRCIFIYRKNNGYNIDYCFLVVNVILNVFVMVIIEEV